MGGLWNQVLQKSAEYIAVKKSWKTENVNILVDFPILRGKWSGFHVTSSSDLSESQSVIAVGSSFGGSIVTVTLSPVLSSLSLSIKSWRISASFRLLKGKNSVFIMNSSYAIRYKKPSANHIKNEENLRQKLWWRTDWTIMKVHAKIHWSTYARIW